MTAPVIHVANTNDFRSKLKGTREAIFLSAGLPYKRSPPKGAKPAEVKRLAAINQSFLDTAASEGTIRSAVVLLTREILGKGLRLVFGAQPAISEMMLSVGRDVVKETDRAEPRILIFQSRYFERELPDSTLDLASWEAGLLVFTPEVRVRRGTREDSKAPSLKLMRELMVCVPGLRAGIFVGGMDGVQAEVDVFRRLNPGKPVIPLASTGSAALQMSLAEPHLAVREFAPHASFAGDSTDAAAADGPKPRISYSLVGKDILTGLGFGEESDVSK